MENVELISTSINRDEKESTIPIAKRFRMTKKKADNSAINSKIRKNG